MCLQNHPFSGRLPSPSTKLTNRISRCFSAMKGHRPCQLYCPKSSQTQAEHLHVVIQVPQLEGGECECFCIFTSLWYSLHRNRLTAFASCSRSAPLKRHHSPSSSGDSKRLRADDQLQNGWLFELHSEIWGRKDLVSRGRNHGCALRRIAKAPWDAISESWLSRLSEHRGSIR